MASHDDITPLIIEPLVRPRLSFYWQKMILLPDIQKADGCLHVNIYFARMRSNVYAEQLLNMKKRNQMFVNDGERITNCLDNWRFHDWHTNLSIVINDSGNILH